MTVCVAAIGGQADGDGKHIFLAADRMITVGDIQYEPPASKIYLISNSIFLMPSGDFNLHTEFIGTLREQAIEFIDANPGSWPSVADFADRYACLYRDKRTKRWEEKALKPVGLSLDALHFTAVDSEFRKELVGQISGSLLPHIGAVVAGFDKSGPHIWTVDDDDALDHTFLGFASTGLGRRHAETQFRLAGHHADAPATETLWLTYLAKRRAEVAPTVGAAATDLVVLGPNLGQYSEVHPAIQEIMRGQYQKILALEADSQTAARSTLNAYMEELRTARVPAVPMGEPQSAEANPDGQKAAGAPEEKVQSPAGDAEPTGDGGSK